MGNIVKKIVLTGGPGAGKSTSIDNIKNYLESLGYLVYIVPEAATDLDNCGIDKTKMSTYDFQKIVLTYQLEREALFEKISTLNKSNKKIILLFDRGILDSKVYTKDDEEFYNLITEENLTEEDILERYDLIVFLETAARIGEYTTENNKARKENTSQAIELDNKTFKVWANHRNIVKIKAEKDFETKKQNTIEIIKNNLKTIKRKQNKYIINMPINELDVDSLVNIEQYYLDLDEVYEHRIRKTTYKDKIKYYYTVQKKEDNGLSTIIEDKIISEKEFIELLNSKPIKKEINKYRKHIILNNIKCNIDIYEDGKCILESIEEPITKTDIDIIEEVTNNKDYLNVNIKINNKQKTLIN